MIVQKNEFFNADLASSTLNGNTSERHGGAFAASGPFAVVYIYNASVVGNTAGGIGRGATGGNGGAGYITDGAEVALRLTEIAQNSAADGTHNGERFGNGGAFFVENDTDNDDTAMFETSLNLDGSRRPQ